MIYVIEAGPDGPLKIGSTVNVEQRMKDLQTGNHEELTIVMSFEGGATLEHQIHKDLKDYQIRKSGEWFKRDDQVFLYLRDLQSVNPKTETIDGDEYIVLWRDTEKSSTEFCPFCGNRHKHGQGDGHRLTHCVPGKETITRQSDGKIFSQRSGYIIRTKSLQGT